MPSSYAEAPLDVFFGHLASQRDRGRRARAQAFSKACQQFSHVALVSSNDRYITLIEQAGAMPRRHDRRVVAADTSKLHPFLRDVTHRHVGNAVAFGVYLPDLEIALAGKLHAPCMRVDQTGLAAVTAFLRTDAPERLVEVHRPNRRDATDYAYVRSPNLVRLLRVITPNGRRQVPMTSLVDALAYRAADSCLLYQSLSRSAEAFKTPKASPRPGTMHPAQAAWPLSRTSAPRCSQIICIPRQSKFRLMLPALPSTASPIGPTLSHT